MQTLRYLPDVVTLTLDAEKCTGCGSCVAVCPHQVFAVEDKKAYIADRDACMECGACAQNCAFQAVFVRSGVGCAAGIILGAISGTEATCGCSPAASETPATVEEPAKVGGYASSASEAP